MRSFTIRENDAGQRMDKFITKAVPKMDAWREDRKKTWAWILENLAYFLPA